MIRAAYRTLSQTYHPDRNVGDAEAARIMAIVNASYDVLSDPQKRAQHDAWIRRQEQLDARTEDIAGRESKAGDARPRGAPYSPAGVVARFGQYILVSGLLAAIVWLVASAYASPPAGSTPSGADSVSTLIPPAYVRPDTTPAGRPWPAVAGYLAGFPRLHTRGLSSVTVDNSRNDSAVFLKLVSLDGAVAVPVRVSFIPARRSLTMRNVAAGTYDIRSRDLTSGALARSEAFTLEETANAKGTQYSDFTMTLYRVRNGSMTSFPLSENEF